jgi:hypothetical protein
MDGIQLALAHGGTFAATFFLAVLAALELSSIDMESL